MKALSVVTLLLVIVGALNWGLYGLFGFDLVAAIFGAGAALSRIVYILVGLSALWQVGPLLRPSAARQYPPTLTAERRDAGRLMRPASPSGASVTRASPANNRVSAPPHRSHGPGNTRRQRTPVRFRGGNRRVGGEVHRNPQDAGAAGPTSRWGS